MLIDQYMLPCLTKTFFGFECFGCGFQRSLVLIFKGQFVDAFWMYPAIYPILILGILILLSKFYRFKFLQKSIPFFGILSIIIIITNYTYKQFIL